MDCAKFQLHWCPAVSQENETEKITSATAEKAKEDIKSHF